MRLSRLLPVCVVVLAVACAGQKRLPPSTEIDETGYRDALRVLASDEFEGRAPGTPGEEKTVAYLVERFRRLGLKPVAGKPASDASYQQAVPLMEIRTEAATLTVTGGPDGTPLRLGTDVVIWTPRDVATATLDGSDLVFAGYGIVAPEYHWNDYDAADVRGKTVVVLANDPGFGSKDPTVFRGSAETPYGLWTYKAAEAARQGAAGILLVHAPEATGYPWRVVVNEFTGPRLEAAWPGGPTQPAVEGWLNDTAARALFARAGVDFTAAAAAAARAGFKVSNLGLKATASIQTSIRHFNSPNVVGVLPGSTRKREAVVYSAHWDHLGRRGDVIFNGAEDDASGVAGLLMLAQSFSRTRPAPQRSIVFIAFTGGDAGLLGSRYYVEHPVYPLRDTVADFNLDQLHIGGPTRDLMIFGFGNSELEDSVRQISLQEGRVVVSDPHPEWGTYYRSDQYSFAKAGVPALDAQGGLDDAARGPGFGQAQLQDYREHRFHQSTDTYAPDWDVRGALADLRLFYEVGNRLADSRRWPRWYPNSEFRGGPAPEAEPGTQ